MSIASDCRSAALALLEDCDLDPYVTNEIKGIFTELDVIFLAAKNAGGYSPEEMRVAQRDASQIMGELFRNRQVTRYGPVSLEALGLGHQDYGRVASKIIYAHPQTGPEQLITPNGAFPRMMFEQDIIKRPGRRLGANRSDLDPWSEQDIVRLVPVSDLGSSSAERRRILSLQSENAALHQRLSEVEGENNRLREQLASAPSRSEVASLEDRVVRIENDLRQEASS